MWHRAHPVPGTGNQGPPIIAKILVLDQVVPHQVDKPGQERIGLIVTKLLCQSIY